MTDNFAEGLIAQLQQCLVEQTETQENDTASLKPTHMRLQRLS
jgi:hypothetical protein